MIFPILKGVIVILPTSFTQFVHMEKYYLLGSQEVGLSLFMRKESIHNLLACTFLNSYLTIGHSKKIGSGFLQETTSLIFIKFAYEY